jgi:predicted HD superfamily hydrolase involved in NAD metabolism
VKQIHQRLKQGKSLKIEHIRDTIKNRVSENRWKHIQGVVFEAQKLALFYGVSSHKAEMAALFHDYCRSLSKDLLNKHVKQIGLDEKIYLDNDKLSHGKIAAELMKSEHGIEDMDILNAVKFHTTGRFNMSTLEKIIYMADAIEPGRTYEGIEKLRELAYQDIDKACIAILEKSVEHVQKNGEVLHKDTLEALRFFKNGKSDQKI